MKKIFYSWQSDVKLARNKFQRALEIAAKQLGDQLEEADRPELDSDTKGTYGSEDIVDTIFSKIDACSIFVADVTPIAETENKLIPNPNVMTEVGYAIKAKGKWRRLYVYCSDDPIQESKMPFDIRGKSLNGFRASDKPSDIAKVLKPILEGMLGNTSPNEDQLDHPYVYISGGSHNNEYATLSVRSDEPDEYFLERIDIAGHVASPNRSLTPKAITKNIIVPGSISLFDQPNPKVKLTISRGGRRFYIEQDIQTTSRVDGKFNFAQWVERPTIVSSFDD